LNPVGEIPVFQASAITSLTSDEAAIKSASAKESRDTDRLCHFYKTGQKSKIST